MSDYIEYLYWCDDCGTWHKDLYDFGEDGKWYVGDENGNWESSGPPSPIESIERSEHSYVKWVAEFGIDPLKMFSPRTKDQLSITYTFEVISPGKFRLTDTYVINQDTLSVTQETPPDSESPILLALSGLEDWKLDPDSKHWVLDLGETVPHAEKFVELAKEMGGTITRIPRNGSNVIQFVLGTKVSRLPRGIEEELKNLARKALPATQERVDHWDTQNSELLHKDKVQQAMYMLHVYTSGLIPLDVKKEFVQMASDAEELTKLLRKEAVKRMEESLPEDTPPVLRGVLTQDFVKHAINWEVTARKLIEFFA